MIGSVARLGLGPRNDVLTTCKAVAFSRGQRIIKVVFIVVLEARSELVEESPKAGWKVRKPIVKPK